VIYNASYVSSISIVIVTYENDCSECICQGLFSNVSPSYVGLNCYKNNKTCALFTTYSSSMIQINLDSTFIFIQQLSLENTSAGNKTSIWILKVIIPSSVMLKILPYHSNSCFEYSQVGEFGSDFEKFIFFFFVLLCFK
jgi:hypothetical protein